MAHHRYPCGILRTFAVAFAIVALAASAAALAPGLARADCPPGKLFAAHAPYPVGSGPRKLVLADFNADGILDLAVCLTDSAGVPDRGGIELLRGGGTNGIWDGTFASAWKWPTGSNPSQARRIVIQDFNADGALDIATSGRQSGGHAVAKLDATGTPITGELTVGGTPALESGLGIAAGCVVAPLCDHVDLDGNLLLAHDPVPGPLLRDGVQAPSEGVGLGCG